MIKRRSMRQNYNEGLIQSKREKKRKRERGGEREIERGESEKENK